ncbi:MAG: DUF5989 family protein [Opitutaceae bacterium]
MSQPERRESDFEADGPPRRRGLLRELAGFLRHNRKYWMAPLILLLLLVGLLILVAGSSIAPFIYPLF